LPDVRLRIVESMSGYIIDWLREGRLDLGLVFGVKSISGVQLEPLIEEDLYLAADSNETLAPLLDENGEVPLHRLASLPMILPTGHHGLRRLFDETAQRHGVTRVSRIEIDSLTQIQRLVQRGFGVTVLSRAALYDSPVDPPLASVRISSPAITRTVALAYSESRSLTKATREIAVRTRAILQERATSSVWQAKPL
jgi:LysR family nitrogen assimilation transcriptional regulator